MGIILELNNYYVILDTNCANLQTENDCVLNVPGPMHPARCLHPITSMLAIPVTDRESLQCWEMLRIPQSRQLAVRLSVLCTGRALLLRNIIFLLLICISVRG
jgi:hypothetical protein